MWQRRKNLFHVLTEEVGQWLDSKLRYIQQEAETFRGRVNFAFLGEEVLEEISSVFLSRQFSCLYALKKRYDHALARIFRIRIIQTKKFEFETKNLKYLWLDIILL